VWRAKVWIDRRDEERGAVGEYAFLSTHPPRHPFSVPPCQAGLEE